MAVITSKEQVVASAAAVSITITGNGRHTSGSSSQLSAYVVKNGTAYESGPQEVTVDAGDSITLCVFGLNTYDWGKGRIYVDGVEVLSGAGNYLEYVYTVAGDTAIELFADANGYYGQITVTTSQGGA